MKRERFGRLLRACLAFFCISAPLGCRGQEMIDTAGFRKLREVQVRTASGGLRDMGEQSGLLLLASRKTSVIGVQNLEVNFSERIPRQIFAQLPGVLVYDMDGTGNQMNVSTRGLDPHRGWEYNSRVDGSMTNSDIFGYPASHFSVPMEAVERIEMVRGTGSLQYGSQFGGMLNYVIRTADTSRLFGGELIQGLGTYGLHTSFAAMGGKYRKSTYYVYANERSTNGYRENSRSTFKAQGIALEYKTGQRHWLNVRLLHSVYRVQLPGMLNDSLFAANPRQASRSRNFFSPDLWVPSLTWNWKGTSGLTMEGRFSMVVGNRSSVMFDKPVTFADTVQAATLEYANRQVDIDRYNSRTLEWRVLQPYQFLGGHGIFTGGMQYLNNRLWRRQQGKGTTGTDFDLSRVDSVWGRDLQLKSQHVAVYAESHWSVTDAWSVTAGVRYERGLSSLSGRISYYPPDSLPWNLHRSIPLMGAGSVYQVGRNCQFYGGWSQGYRPVILKDIIPAAVYERVDPNLKDASGHNAELGCRGKRGGWTWDATFFELLYRNRFGNVVDASTGNLNIWKTNTGDTRTWGLELGVDYVHFIGGHRVRVFSATAVMRARYLRGSVRQGEANLDIRGKSLEGVPEVITRNGLEWKQGNWGGSVLYSYTASSFADALNTRLPNDSGSLGLVPAYGLLDANLSWALKPGVVLRCSAGNITGRSYFTRRPAFYPGPGIWPSDGATLLLTLRVGF
jgi:Fe(3+) dicitrate transport protein